MGPAPAKTTVVVTSVGGDEATMGPAPATTTVVITSGGGEEIDCIAPAEGSISTDVRVAGTCTVTNIVFCVCARQCACADGQKGGGCNIQFLRSLIPGLLLRRCLAAYRSQPGFYLRTRPGGTPRTRDARVRCLRRRQQGTRGRRPCIRRIRSDRRSGRRRPAGGLGTGMVFVRR